MPETGIPSHGVTLLSGGWLARGGSTRADSPSGRSWADKLVLTLGGLAAPRVAAALQPAKVYRIGVLGPSSTANAVAIMEEMRQGLHELGYVEGRHFTVEIRAADGRPERLPELAAELVRLPVDLIMMHGVSGVRAARQATTTLPIVMLDGGDPVEAGRVESQARAGGNITGSFFSGQELKAKRLELLKEAVPGVTRVAVLRAADPL